MFNVKKSLIALLACLCVSAGSLAACGGEQGASTHSSSKTSSETEQSSSEDTERSSFEEIEESSSENSSHNDGYENPEKEVWEDWE